MSTRDTELVEIGVAANEVGVTPSTLRSWERRYRLVVPRRGPQGQRLYHPDEVSILRQIQTEIRLGVRAADAHNAALTRSSRGSLRIELLPNTQAPRLARQAVDAVVEPTEMRMAAYSARLVAAELVNNALQHGRPRKPIVLEVAVDASLVRIRVHNSGLPLSLKALRSRRSGSGWGLEIVDALASWWNIESGPLGTTVTVCLPADDGGFETGKEGIHASESE